MFRIFRPFSRRYRFACLFLLPLLVTSPSAAADSSATVVERLSSVELLAFEASDGRVVLRVGDGEPTLVGEGETLPGMPEASLVQVLPRRLVVEWTERDRPGLQAWLEPLGGGARKASQEGARCRVTAVDPNRPVPPVLPVPSKSLPMPIGPGPDEPVDPESAGSEKAGSESTSQTGGER